MENISSRTLTTSGESRVRFIATELVLPRSGSRPRLMRWSGLHRQQTREPACGGDLVRQICHSPSRESLCWGHLWETLRSSKRIWTRRWRNNGRCWSGFPLVADLQSSWLILLHCASAKANYLLRVVEPQSVAAYDRAGIWACLCTLLHQSLAEQRHQEWGQFAIGLDGVGLRNATRTSISAYWDSWADCLPLMFAKHTEVAFWLARQLEGHPNSPFPSAAASSARVLSGTMGFDPQSWQALCEGVRRRMLEPGVGAGSMRLLHEWNSSTRKKKSVKGCHLEIEHGCDRKVVLEAVWP